MAQNPAGAGLALVTGGNFLVIVLDDIGIEALAAYGEGQISAPTPQHRLAGGRRGALPLCLRQPLLLADARHVADRPLRLPHRHRQPGDELVVGAAGRARSRCPTCCAKPASWFDDAAFGKWHLGNNSVGGRWAPNRAGWWHFSGELNNSQDYFSWLKVIDGQGYQVTGYLTTDQVDDAIAWIQARDRRWLCYLAVTAAHAPLHAPPAHLHGFSLANSYPLAGEDPLPYFHAMIEALDTELGRLFDVLDFTTTHVVLVGDNGSSDATIVAPFTASQNKGSVHEGGTRVPLIVKSPAVVGPGRVVDAMVNTVDLMASMAELLGIDLAGLGLPVHDSISFAPYLVDPDQAPRRQHAFSENFKPLGYGPFTLIKRALRDERYKLITELGASDELYDLWLDPYEAAPLDLAALTGPQQAAYAALHQKLAELLDS